MKKTVALLLCAVMMLGLTGVASANEPIERIRYLFDKIDQLNATNIYSDDEVSCVLVDLSQISTTGSVTSYTYENTVNPIANSFTSRTMTLTEATSNMTRYILGDIRAAYLDPPFNCSIAMSVYERTSIPVYVYGDGKDYCIDEIELALPNVFAVQYTKKSSGGSNKSLPQPDQAITLPVATQVLNAIFSISSTTYTVTANDTTETKTMDVAPEVRDNRTFVPVRFLAYSLGVPEDGVQWNPQTQTVTIAKDETALSLTIGNNVMTVNGEPLQMDITPYIKNDRTMLPARWVAEPLGAKVTWDEATQQVKIEIEKQGL